MVRIVLLGTPAFLDRCQESLQFQSMLKIAGRTTSMRDACDMAREMETDLILVEDVFDLDRVARLVQLLPHTAVVLVSGRPSIDLQRAAVQRGIRAVVQDPLDPRELLEAVDQIRSTTQYRAASGLEFEDEDEPDLFTETHRTSGFVRQEVIAIHSPKGGVGKTTLALNLAVQYRLTFGPQTRVLLVDLDPFGNMIGTLDLDGYATVEHWADLERDPSAAQIETELVQKERETGIHVIPAPRMVYALRSMETHAIGRILSVCRRHYDIIVIDLCPILLDAQVLALEHATRIYEVILLEVPTLRAINDFRILLDRFREVNQTNIGLVVNRVPHELPRPFKSWREIQELYLPPWPIVARIPESQEVVEAANLARPVVTMFPDSPVSQEIRKLVGGTVGGEPKPRRGWFRGLLGR